MSRICSGHHTIARVTRRTTIEDPAAGAVFRRDRLAVVSDGSQGAAYFAPTVVERLGHDGPAFGPTALILTPTRDEAIRVHETFLQLTDRGETARLATAFEGKPLTSQIGPLKHGADIVVGTPGRVAEHVKRRTLRIEQLKILALHSADRILELGFGKELEAVLEATPSTRQTIVTTIEASQRVLTIGRRHLSDPELFGIEPDDFTAVPVPGELDVRTANLYFGLGKGARITPRDLVGALINEGGLRRDQIGAVKIKQNFSLVAVPADQVKELAGKLRSIQIKGRKAKIRPERF